MTVNLADKAPVVDPERIARTYSELKKMEIRLDPNPIEYGPKRFNHRIAKTRAMLTRLEQIFLQTSEDLHYFKRRISAKTALYELDKRDLMINDPKCRVGRSQGEREALADVQLRPEIESLQTLILAAQDLESLMVVIKSKRTDLKDIQGRMREQMKLIEHDIGMGARWGSNSPPLSTMGSSASDSVAQSVSEIDSLLVDPNSLPYGPGDETVEEDEEETVEEDEEETVEEDEEETVEALVEEYGASEEPVQKIVEAEDPKEDPAPHAEPEVLVFGDKEEETVSENSEDLLENLLPNDDSENALPERHSSQESIDSFLDELDAGQGEVAESEVEDAPVQGIDDLIASLSDD